MEETTPYVIGRTIGRLGRTNPVGLASLGISSLVAANALLEEYPLPEGDTGLRKRKSNMGGPPTKRIKHHSRQPRLTPGESNHHYYQQDDCHVGKLYMNRLRLPAVETFATSARQRERAIYLKGFKMDAEWFGKHAEYSPAPTQHPRGFMGPCVVNFALIQFNCKQDMAPETDPALALYGEWWSSHEGEGNASRPFLQLDPVDGDAVDKWQDYWLHGAINPHHEAGFKILARERTVVQQTLQNGAVPGQKNWGRVSKYYKIAQPIYLHDNEEAEWMYPIYTIFWISPLNPEYLRNYPSTGDPETQPARHFFFKNRVITYFKEVPK